MQILVVFLLTLTSIFGQSLSEIRGLIQDHQYVQAEIDLQRGLQEHPRSALGWYYYAQDEYFLGKYDAARSALAKAQALDSQLSFTHDPQDFYRLLEQLRVSSRSTLHTYSSPNTISQAPNFLTLLIFFLGFILLIVLVAFLFSIFNRRSFGYNAPLINPTPFGLPPSSVYPMQSNSGIGTFLGGMAAGALADDLLRPRPEIIREEIIVEPEDRSVDRLSDPLPFDPGNTSQDWSSNDSPSGFDSGNSTTDQNSW